MPASDDQIRLDILLLLRKRFIDNPEGPGVDRAIIQDTLKIPEKQMDLNMSYLEEKSLVALYRVQSAQWIFAKLTDEGKEVVENMPRYAEQFSFLQIATGQVSEKEREKEPEPVFEAEPTELSFSQQITEAFRQASDEVFRLKLSSGDKGKIIKQLKALEKELQKVEKADLGTIQKDWEWLKKNAYSVTRPLSSVVLEAIKMALDLQ